MNNMIFKFVALFLVLGVALTSNAQQQKTESRPKAQAKTRETRETKSYSRNYGMAGCGLGSVVAGKEGGQVFASTTNSTFYNQLFAITSGTLNCVDEESNVVASRTDYYIQANRYALESDVARGGGETLAGLSQVLGCKSDKVLGTSLQENYSKVFRTGSAPNIVTDSIITVILNSEALSTDCHLS